MNVDIDGRKTDNPVTKRESVRDLVKSGDRRVRLRIAEDPTSPSDVLAKLANDSEPEIRAAVGCNPSTPFYVVRELANDEHDDVRYFMAEDPNLPAEILCKLRKDQNPFVRDCAEKTVDALALEGNLDEECFVRYAGTIGRLGELLTLSEVLSQEQVDECVVLAKAKGYPLGQALILRGFADRPTIAFALKQQAVVRLGQITLQAAVEKIKAYKRGISRDLTIGGALWAWLMPRP